MVYGFRGLAFRCLGGVKIPNSEGLWVHSTL